MTQSVYPGQLDLFTEHTDGLQYVILADHINYPQSAVLAIEQTLGINPQGAYPTVAERLDSMVGGGGATRTFEEFDALTDGTGTLTLSLTLANEPKAILNMFAFDVTNNYMGISLTSNAFVMSALNTAVQAVTGGIASGAIIDGTNLAYAQGALSSDAVYKVWVDYLY